MQPYAQRGIGDDVLGHVVEHVLHHVPECHAQTGEFEVLALEQCRQRGPAALGLRPCRDPGRGERPGRRLDPQYRPAVQRADEVGHVHAWELVEFHPVEVDVRFGGNRCGAAAGQPPGHQGVEAPERGRS
ncbi:hypothetical protein [Streptomyces sp. NPDC018693]|uniref:hypothetical protein n=1 Tax=unclassified Streptomyces TaxID=2593676 RepID=UPI0037995108